MYARLVLYTLGQGMHSAAQKIIEEMSPRVKARKGFKGLYFFGDDETGEYGALSLYETKEDAEASKEALFPIFQNALSGISKSPPSIRLFKVLEPKA